MSTVLQAHELTRHYSVSRGLFKPAATVQALNGVSFTLAAGRTLAVVGESGCGKSVLTEALTGLLPGTAAVRGSAATTTEASMRSIPPVRIPPRPAARIPAPPA